MISSIFFQELSKAISQTKIIEWYAILFFLGFLFFAAKEKRFCWLLGIISSSIYAKIFFSAEQYLACGVSGAHIILAALGWQQWGSRTREEGTKGIFRLSLRQAGLGIAITGLLGWSAGFLLEKHSTTDQPYFFGEIEMFSLFATWILARKFRENWFFWIVIFSVSAFLSFGRGNYLACLLNIQYGILAIYGLISWETSLRKIKYPGSR